MAHNDTETRPPKESRTSSVGLVLAAERRGDVDALVASLSDTVPTVRMMAASSLGRLEAVEAVGPLLRLLNTHNVIVRNAAIDALASIGDEAAIEPLYDVTREDEL